MLKDMKKSVMTMCLQTENVNYKWKSFFKKKQVEILKLKCVMTKVKILLGRFDGRSELTKERIGELEGKLIVILESNEKRREMNTALEKLKTHVC